VNLNLLQWHAFPLPGALSRGKALIGGRKSTDTRKNALAGRYILIILFRGVCMRIKTFFILLAGILFAGCATRYQDGLRGVQPPEESWQLVRETVLMSEGKPEQRREFFYSPGGDLVREKIFDAAGRIRTIVFYDYRDGRATERRSYNENGILMGKRTYTYTSKGLPETENYFDGSDRLLMSSKFTYNYWGDKTEWLTVDAGGRLIASTRYAYEKGLPSVMNLRGAQGEESTITLAYDGQGRKIHETYLNASGNLEKEIAFSYDAQGRLIGEEIFSAFKTSLGKTVYEYSTEAGRTKKIYRYDARGNPKETVIHDFVLQEKTGEASL
jgi:hypothetical protein